VDWTGFKAGLTRPSATAWLTCLLLAAAAVGAAEGWARDLGPWRGPLRVMYTSTHDDAAHVSYLLAELTAAPRDELKVLVLGSSFTREGLLERPRVDRLLREALGRPARLYNLSLSGASFAELLAILENTGEGWPGVVCVGVSPATLFSEGFGGYARAALHEALPHRAPAMEAILAESGFQSASSPLALVRQRSWIRRYARVRLGAETPFAYQPYRYVGPTPQPPWPLPDWRSDQAFHLAFGRHLRREERNWQLNRRLLGAILDWRDRTGVPVILIENTLHPEMKTRVAAEFPGALARYAERRAALCAERGVSYYDLPALAGIQDDDFYDGAHVLSGKDRYTAQLVKAVAEAAGRAP